MFSYTEMETVTKFLDLMRAGKVSYTLELENGLHIKDGKPRLKIAVVWLIDDPEADPDYKSWMYFDKNSATQLRDFINDWLESAET